MAAGAVLCLFRIYFLRSLVKSLKICARTERGCVQLRYVCYRAAQWLDVQRKEMDTATLNLNSTWLSGNFLTTVELRIRGLNKRMSGRIMGTFW